MKNEEKIKKLDNAAEQRCVEILLKAEKREKDGVEQRIITGYALKFDTLSKLLGGWFKEKINRGALDNCDMSDVIACFNHDSTKILARTSSNTLQLTVDDEGLKYEFECPNTTYGNDLWESVSRGDINKSSFMFIAEDSTWETLDGVDVRTILKIRKIYDVSPVVWPAYDDTTAAKRSLEKFQQKGDGPDEGYEAFRAKRGLELRKIFIH